MTSTSRSPAIVEAARRRCSSCSRVTPRAPHASDCGTPPGQDRSALSSAQLRVSAFLRLVKSFTKRLSGVDGYAAELGLATELPAAIAQYRGHWIEYGVAERAYALQCPDDFAAIVSRYGHTAIRPKQYTGYLARVFAEQESAECRFEVPIADGVSCSVPGPTASSWRNATSGATADASSGGRSR